MADIELVIKIPENSYKATCSSSMLPPDVENVVNAIKNGTPLPKGHGRIGDIDKMIDRKCNECGHIRGVSCTIPCYTVRRMLDVPIIIEADKESEVEDDKE